MTIKDLKQRIKELAELGMNVNGYSKLRKEELEKLVSQLEEELIKNKLDEEAKAHQESKVGGGELSKEVAEAKLKELTALSDSPDSEGKEKKMRTEKVVYKYTPVITVPVKGIRIVWAKAGGQDISLLRDDTFEIAVGNAWYQAYLDGLVVPVIMEVSDPEIRTKVLHHAMDKLKFGTKEKYGKPKVLIGKTVDSDRAIMFLCFRADIKKIIGVDPSYKTPISKVTLPTFSNQMLQLESSTINWLKLKVVDPRIHHGGVNTNDGAVYIDGIRFYYKEYLSMKDLEAGKKPKLVMLKSGQLRGYKEIPIQKDCASMDTFLGRAAEFCKANGLELGCCHGAIDIESIKGNVSEDKVMYHHGDVMSIPIEELRFINTSSPEGVSRCGVQLVCCDTSASTALLEESRLTHGEPGIAAKGKIFKDACAGKAEAVAEIIKATYSIKDSYLQEIKSLLFAIPKDSNRKVVAQDNENVEWYSPEWEGIHNQLNSRRVAYYFNNLIKVRTSITNHYFMAHPSVLLDELERAWFRETGQIVNYGIAPDDKKFAQQVAEFKFSNIGRAPQQYDGSIQEILYLREDDDGNIIVDPDAIRNKKGHLIAEGDGIVVSHGLITCLNGDFDGDIATEVFSNTAQFPMWRPDDIPNIFGHVDPEDDPEIKYIQDDDAYIEEQKRDYKNIIWSQVAIGMFDNFSRLLFTMRRNTSGKEVYINGIKRIGKPIPIEIGRKISEQREDTIKAKKHDIDVDHIKNVIQDFTRWYAPNGRLPMGESRPASFLLLHNKLGDVEAQDGTTMMRRLCGLINRINHIDSIHELDCYKALWKALDGLKIFKCNADSQYWRNEFYKLWNNRDSLFDNTISKTTVARIEWFANYITGYGDLNGEEFADDLDKRFSKEVSKDVKFSGYRFWSGYFSSEPDEDKRQELYSILFTRIDAAVEKWLDDMSQGDSIKKDVYHKLLAIYLGVISFGSSVRKSDQKSYALPGYAFWCMPKDILAWIASKVHPNNPFLSKYIKL